MADLAAALAAAEAGVGGKTHENDSRAWSQYISYRDSIGLTSNYFLDGLTRQQRIAIMGAFAVAICEGRFSRPGDGPLAKKSVQNTINAVVRTFCENGREDPHRDAERQVSRLLQWQMRSYKKMTQKKNNKKPYRSASIASYSRPHHQSFVEQQQNLQQQLIFGPCDHANT
jgi:hypothetical protein